jgi:hypothetical protein
MPPSRQPAVSGGRGDDDRDSFFQKKKENVFFSSF